MLRPAGVVLLLLVATHAADQTLFEDFETGFVGTDGADVLTNELDFAFSSGTITARLFCGIDNDASPAASCQGVETGGASATAFVHSPGTHDCDAGSNCAAAAGTRFVSSITGGGSGDTYGLVFSTPVKTVQLDIFDAEANTAVITCYSDSAYGADGGASYQTAFDCNPDHCNDGDVFTMSSSAGTAGNALLSCVVTGLDAGTGMDNVVVTYDNPESNPRRCGDFDSGNGGFWYSLTNLPTGCDGTQSNNCFYTTSELATAATASLRLEADGAPYSRLASSGTDDFLYLSFDLPSKYYDPKLVFADSTAGECDAWELVTLPGQDTTTKLNGCLLEYEYRLRWSDAYASDSSKCGWTREQDGTTGVVTLTLDFGVLVQEDVSESRNGDPIRRELLFAMPPQLEFPTQVEAAVTQMRVLAPVRILAALTKQEVSVDEATNTATMTLNLNTEVQAPFEVYAISEGTSTLPTGVTIAGGAAALDGDDDTTARLDAECTDTLQDCANTWEWSYEMDSTVLPCDFDGNYEVDFLIRCSDNTIGGGDCPIDDNTNQATITFTVNTNQHCPSIIDSISLSASIEVYDNPERTNVADDFVGDGVQEDGQTPVNEGDADQWQVAYFAVPVIATEVALSSTELSSVLVSRPNTPANDDVTLLDQAANACSAVEYAAADDTANCAGETGLDGSTCQLIAPGNTFPDKCGTFDFAHRKGDAAIAGAASTPWFEFDINTGASGFNMGEDEIESMVVTAIVDVTYANPVSKRTLGANVQSSEPRGAKIMSASSSFITTTVQPPPATSSSSSSATTMFGMSSMIVYGAAALAVLTVVAVFAMVRRRRRNKGQKDDLVQSSSLASVNDIAKGDVEVGVMPSRHEHSDDDGEEE